MEDQDVCDGIDLKWMHQSDSDDDDDWYSSAPVKYFTQEMSCRGRLRRLLIRNTPARLGGRLFDFLVKFVMCLLYFIRVLLDDHTQYWCNGQACVNNTLPDILPLNENDGMLHSSAQINWHVVLWVSRPMPLWCIQVILAAATFVKAIIFIFVSKGNRLEHVLSSAFFLECICSIPLMVTAFYPMVLKDLFIPTFLNCWLAKLALERLFNDLHLTKQRFQTISVTLSQQLLILSVTLCCLTFTTICGIQHIQRGSLEKHLTMFEAFYFVIVTFSTVGYGDISPDIWLGQLFVVIMICVAFVFLPRQIEGIASTFVERQKAGGEYGKKQARRNKHVVVCSTQLSAASTMDFLTEFYAHPKLEDHIVLLLGSDELGSDMNIILRDPKWSNRVIYMRGSALKDLDLKRCRINEAEACFILAPGKVTNKEQADKHTILRSWAVKDFAPNCNQYIQLFRAENKMHVKFAEHVVCQDEFKYALLANNCLYPGLSTLVSLLVHTSTGHEGEIATETWQQVYGRHSGNEIYHIQLSKSKFFNSYEGKKFTEASADAHQRFGITLMGVMETDSSQNNDIRLQLNPGPNYVLKATDFCFYMNITKEEYSKIKEDKKRKTKSEREKNYEKIANQLEKFLESHGGEYDDDEDDGGEESVFNTLTSQSGIEMTKRMFSVGSQGDRTEMSIDTIGLNSEDQVDGADKVLQMYDDMGQDEFITGPPPIAMYLGTKRTICHLVKKRRENCCLKWGESCSHCDYKHATDPRWHNQLIILAGQCICRGIFNFIVPLRSQFISMKSLSPIILLVEEKPDKIFLETIAHFPLVYWMQGKISNVDDLLKAGINKACHLVVVNRESSVDAEEVLIDSETVVAVQTVFKLFPNTNIITELSQAQNMRFMQFQAHDQYSQQISRLEKRLKEEMHSSLTYIFRLPFAAGQVFSCSMLDSLLYQTFVKGYLIKFVRLLLGIDAELNSGHLSSIKVKRSILAKYRTYGDLYKGLCSVTGEIPIAIYRTERHRNGVKTDEVDGTNNNFNGDGVQKRTKSSEVDKEKKVSLNINQFYERSEHDGISDLIKHRMMSLDMDSEDYCGGDNKRKRTISYIMLNPSPRRKLKVGDLVYVIQPASMFAVPSRLNNQSKFARRKSWSAPASEKDESPIAYQSSGRERSQSVNIIQTDTKSKKIAGKSHIFTLEVPQEAHA